MVKAVMQLYSWISQVPVLGRAIEDARDWKSLRYYAKRGYYSQHGEDRFLAEYFGDRTGSYIDVGANHPFRISNTYLFYQKGWTGITVEPIPHLADSHCRLRPRDTLLRYAIGRENGILPFYFLVPSVLSTFDADTAKQLIDAGKARLRKKMDVSVVPLAQLFEEHFANRTCDILSVDTEGFDFQILSSNDWSKHRPRVVVFEANDQDELSSCTDLLASKGYCELKQFGCNHIYRREEN